MLTKPSPSPTHKKPFFPRKIGLTDIIRLCDSTPLSSDKTRDTVDDSSLLKSPESVSRVVGGSTWIEFQSLPTNRLRRPDTETGQRAPMTGHSESTSTPSRNIMPECGIQQAKSPKKPLSAWRQFILFVSYFIVWQTVFAVGLGGLGRVQSSDNDVLIEILLSVAVLHVLFLKWLLHVVTSDGKNLISLSIMMKLKGGYILHE